MNDLLLEAVGFLAGSIVTAAALPRVIDILRDSTIARGESYARNAMLALGNIIWIVYGVAGHAEAIVVMCGLSATLNGMILVATIRANRRQPT
jgi:uncharacterized protein with PQ loop repeat